MPVVCCAVGCYNNTRSDGFLMKGFPSDPDRKDLWAFQVRRLNWKPTKNSVICEVHFMPEMFESRRADGKRMLKPYAVPTLFDRSQPLFKTRKPRAKRRNAPNRSEPIDETIIIQDDAEDEVMDEIENTIT